MFWTNLFNHQKTYQKPTKPISSPEPVWNKAYQVHLTQLIQALEYQTPQQKLLQLSLYLDKALQKPPIN